MRTYFSLALSLFLAPSVFAFRPTVPGDVAVLKGNIAYAPEKAPPAVKQAIWAVNGIVHKPYRRGGGHATFYDHAYDCSGTVSFLLHHAGVLDAPSPSNGLRRWGKSGRGKWITVYVRPGHAFAVVAGLRLDTTGRSEREGPRWRTASRSLGKFEARHHAGL